MLLGFRGDPIVNPTRDEFYTILPDPQDENALHRHVAAIKVRGDNFKEPLGG